MSHIDASALASYNSLRDPHLSGYFSHPQRRRHLLKVGLIKRNGRLVSENEYRQRLSQTEHRKHVRDVLAQAIVHKALDMERQRQVTIRKKLEEIAKLDLVQRVRSEENRKSQDENLLPYLSPRSKSKSRPKSAPPNKRKDSRDEDELVLVMDTSGMPMSPHSSSGPRSRPVSSKPRPRSSQYPQEVIDDRHLYSLDQRTLKEYKDALYAIDSGRGPSPYIYPMPVPPPMRSTQKPRTSTARRRPVTATQRSSRNSEDTEMGTLMLHRLEPAVKNQDDMQTMCLVNLHYFGQELNVSCEKLDPRDEVLVLQQHCGGNTLPVFKKLILPNTDFTFKSRRHRGFPFGLAIYVNGVLDCRFSTCCEYKHSQNSRHPGSKGHFGIVRVTGAEPCYRCKVAQEDKKKDSKKKSKSKQDKAKSTEVPVDKDEQESKTDRTEYTVRGIEDETDEGLVTMSGVIILDEPEWSEDFADAESEEYAELAKEVTDSLYAALKGTSFSRNMKASVRDFREGSVIVSFKLSVEGPVQTEELLKAIQEGYKKLLQKKSAFFTIANVYTDIKLEEQTDEHLSIPMDGSSKADEDNASQYESDFEKEDKKDSARDGKSSTASSARSSPRRRSSSSDSDQGPKKIRHDSSDDSDHGPKKTRRDSSNDSDHEPKKTRHDSSDDSDHGPKKTRRDSSDDSDHEQKKTSHHASSDDSDNDGGDKSRSNKADKADSSAVFEESDKLQNNYQTHHDDTEHISHQPATSYRVSVKTGDKRGAGTDASVFLRIFGESKDTGDHPLKRSDTYFNKFERGRTDLFVVEAEDVGKIQKIRIGHDSTKLGSGWFLDEVSIDVPTQGKNYVFPCHRWLDKGEEDGETYVVLTPSYPSDMDKRKPVVYETQKSPSRSSSTSSVTSKSSSHSSSSAKFSGKGDAEEVVQIPIAAVYNKKHIDRPASSSSEDIPDSPVYSRKYDVAIHKPEAKVLVTPPERGIKHEISSGTADSSSSSSSSDSDNEGTSYTVPARKLASPTVVKCEMKFRNNDERTPSRQSSISSTNSSHSKNVNKEEPNQVTKIYGKPPLKTIETGVAIGTSDSSSSSSESERDDDTPRISAKKSPSPPPVRNEVTHKEVEPNVVTKTYAIPPLKTIETAAAPETSDSSSSSSDSESDDDTPRLTTQKSPSPPPVRNEVKQKEVEKQQRKSSTSSTSSSNSKHEPNNKEPNVAIKTLNIPALKTIETAAASETSDSSSSSSDSESDDDTPRITAQKSPSPPPVKNEVKHKEVEEHQRKPSASSTSSSNSNRSAAKEKLSPRVFQSKPELKIPVSQHDEVVSKAKEDEDSSSSSSSDSDTSDDEDTEVEVTTHYTSKDKPHDEKPEKPSPPNAADVKSQREVAEEVVAKLQAAVKKAPIKEDSEKESETSSSSSSDSSDSSDSEDETALGRKGAVDPEKHGINEQVNHQRRKNSSSSSSSEKKGDGEPAQGVKEESVKSSSSGPKDDERQIHAHLEQNVVKKDLSDKDDASSASSSSSSGGISDSDDEFLPVSNVAHEVDIDGLVRGKQDVILNNIEFSDEKVHKLCHALLDNSDLRTLKIISINNTFNDDHLDQVVNVLSQREKCPRLRSLHLQVNLLDSTSTRRLTEVIQSKDIEHLALHNTPLKGIDLKHVITVLVEREKLSSLELVNMKLDNKAANHLANSLAKSKVPLQSLTLDNNPYIEYSGWKQIIEMSGKLPNLQSLSIRNCNMHGDRAEALRDGLPLRQGIAFKLNIEDNGMTDSDAYWISGESGFLRRTRITSMNFEKGNQFSEEVLSRIKDDLQANREKH